MCISQNRESIFEIIQHEIKIRWPFASSATVHELFMMMYQCTTYFRHTDFVELRFLIPNYSETGRTDQPFARGVLVGTRALPL